jgi:hypothetical protein
MMEEQFGWRVSEAVRNALRLLDTEDLHCLRVARQKAFKENRPLGKLICFGSSQKPVFCVVFVLMISEYEMHLLTEIFKIDRSCYFTCLFTGTVKQYGFR